ncbi:polysaccharide deacetylase family protein [Paractinoplanes toevensis]|nr:polysaccharide deacetylase family protein [Actinoplanes toevensis]
MEAVQASGRVPLTARQLGACLRGEQPLPEHAIALTFDDGFADFAEVALPIMEKLSLSSTLFMTTGYFDRPGMLSPAALRDIASVDSLEIGAHSVTHPHMDVLNAATELKEAADSRKHLEDLLGMTVDSFAYPHGSHSRRTRSAIAQAGYVNAHAVKNAISHQTDDCLAVARFTVVTDTEREQVARVIGATGAPISWKGERLRTRGYRLARRLMAGARS